MLKLIACVSMCLFVAPIASAQTFEIASLATGGAQGDFDSFGGAVSADGRFVAFTSTATNFSTNDPSGPLGPDSDAYLRDRVTGTTTHVSIAFDSAFVANISADGAFVTFNTNAVTPAGFGFTRSWIWERATGLAQPITISNMSSFAPELSADGRYVAFVGRDVSGPSPSAWLPVQAFRLDRISGNLTLASRATNGTPSNGTASSVSISADGARVAFGSAASDLALNDTNGVNDVFVFDAATQLVERISVDVNGTQGDAYSDIPSLSADGLFVGYFSLATNLVPADTNGAGDLFLREIATGMVQRVSLSSTGLEVFSSYNLVKISADGRLAYFSGNASTFVPNDNNNGFDVFVRDTQNNTTRRWSELPGIEGNGNSWVSSISSDGRFATFVGYTSNLVASDINGVQDVFLLDIGPPCSATNYCSALPNSTGLPASLGTQGEASVSFNNLTLSCIDLPAQTTGRFSFGTSPIDPGTPFGNGLKCIGGTLQILPSMHVSGTVAIQFQDLSSAPYAAVQPGDTRYFQFMYRNVAAGGAQFNTSDALAITFCP